MSTARNEISTGTTSSVPTEGPELLLQANNFEKHIEQLDSLTFKLSSALDRLRPPCPTKEDSSKRNAKDISCLKR